MNLTLRKANAIQAAINESIKGLKMEVNTTLHEYEAIGEQLTLARDRFWKNFQTRNQLTKSLYEIRAKVAQQNANSGINDKLSEVAYIDKQIGYNNQLIQNGLMKPLKVLQGEVEKNAEATEDRFAYGRRDVTTSILDEDEIVDLKTELAKLKREKQKIQDVLLELNIQTQIELSEETVTTLKEIGIL